MMIDALDDFDDTVRNTHLWHNDGHRLKDCDTFIRILKNL